MAVQDRPDRPDRPNLVDEPLDCMVERGGGEGGLDAVEGGGAAGDGDHPLDLRCVEPAEEDSEGGAR